MSQIYSSRKVALLLGADPTSVNRWIDIGKLKAYRTPGGHRRVQHDDLLEFLARCDMPVPEELKPEQLGVLLVDSDQQFIRSLRRALRRARRDLKIETCASLHQALVIIGARRPDVVIWNLDLDTRRCLEVCQSIKSIPETRETLLITHLASASSALERKLLSAGAGAVLVRPFRYAAMLELLATLK